MSRKNKKKKRIRANKANKVYKADKVIKDNVKVHRHTRIDRELPNEVSEQIHNMLIDNATYSEIKDYLEGKAVVLKDNEYKLDGNRTYNISESSIGRYGRNFIGLYKQMYVAMKQATALVSEANKDGLVLEEAISKILSAKIFEIVQNETINISETVSIIKGVANLQSSSVQRERYKSSNKRKIQSIAEKHGLSDDAVKEINEKILGI